MNALYLVIMLVAPKCTGPACAPKADVFFTYKKAEAEASLGYGAMVWKVFPSLRVAKLKAGSGGVVFSTAVKVK